MSAVSMMLGNIEASWRTSHEGVELIVWFEKCKCFQNLIVDGEPLFNLNGGFNIKRGGGGNFHLKVGGAKSSGNAGDPILGVAVVP